MTPSEDLDRLIKNIQHALREIADYREDLSVDDATHNYRHKDSVRFCLNAIEKALLHERKEP